LHSLASSKQDCATRFILLIDPCAIRIKGLASVWVDIHQPEWTTAAVQLIGVSIGKCEGLDTWSLGFNSNEDEVIAGAFGVTINPSNHMLNLVNKQLTGIE
jgi:hypothetical protein